MKTGQDKRNPFPYTDSNKRYYTYDYYLKQTYGEKCAKITLDAGFGCPNADGRCGVGGCIYCSSRGSGDFAQMPTVPLSEQFERQRLVMQRKWQVRKFIPYLQAHTNTYAPVERLREVYSEVLLLPQAVGMHIATRADCIDGEIAALLADVADRIPLTVELGLQSSNDTTAALINRGHDYAAFLRGYGLLRSASPRIRVGIHVINGLPGEGEREMLETVRDVAALCPDEVKIHLLYVLKGTVLGRLWEEGKYTPMEREAYVETVVRQLELLPPQIVVGRVTGDSPGELLLAPDWSRRKIAVINEIDKLQYALDTWQGKKYLP